MIDVGSDTLPEYEHFMHRLLIKRLEYAYIYIYIIYFPEISSAWFKYLSKQKATLPVSDTAIASVTQSVLKMLTHANYKCSS